MRQPLWVLWLILPIFATFSSAVYAKVDGCTAVKAGIAEAVSFKTKTQSEHRVSIDAVLMKPDGKGPFPGMVILHGGGGVYPLRCYQGALRLFVELGYTSLLIDSTSAQRPSRMGMGGYTFEDQAQDAHKGREFLRTLPYVQSESIGVIGWSTGGGAVLDAVSRSKRTFPIEKEAPFEAAVAFYPFCFKHLKDLDAPLLILIGEKDTETPAVTCREMKVTRKTGIEYQLKIYPGAGHIYEAPWSSNYDKAAAQDSMDRLKKFFAQYLQK